MIIHCSKKIRNNVNGCFAETKNISFGGRVWKIDRSALTRIQEKFHALHNITGVLLSAPGELRLIKSVVTDGCWNLRLTKTWET